SPRCPRFARTENVHGRPRSETLARGHETNVRARRRRAAPSQGPRAAPGRCAAGNDPAFLREGSTGRPLAAQGAESLDRSSAGKDRAHVRSVVSDPALHSARSSTTATQYDVDPTVRCAGRPRAATVLRSSGGARSVAVSVWRPRTRPTRTTRDRGIERS